MDGKNIAALKKSTTGRWLEVLAALCPSLSEAIANAPNHVPCPRMGGKDGYRLYSDVNETGGSVCNQCGSFSDGLATIQFANGWDFNETVQTLEDYLGEGAIRAASPPPPPPRQNTVNLTSKQRIVEVWNASIPDNGIISSYFVGRGLSGKVPEPLHLHPALEYFHEGKVIGVYPAMVAPIQAPNGWLVSLHRTYLSFNGEFYVKADVPSPKKVMTAIYPGASMGGAIRLGPVEPTINLAEGLETALAVQEYNGHTSLAAVSAAGLRAFEPPSGVQFIRIWSDHDTSQTGQRAAAALERRLAANYAVVVELPNEAGEDFLDVLTRKEH